MTVAQINLWGRQIAAVSVDGPSGIPAFQYTPDFARSGIEVSPVRMPLAVEPYVFPALGRLDAFRGLPGLLADALPDRWGNTLISAWLEARGRAESSFDVVERLCYVGRRGMGALEFEPAGSAGSPGSTDLDVDRLVELAGDVLADRHKFAARISADPQQEEMEAILAVGTSAGGARPKAIIAYNPETGQVRSGQLEAPPGFTHWLLKFDGVEQAGDHGLRDPQGWGAVEYAYHLMALDCEIEMTECRLLTEHGRRHFMTRRFDRPERDDKLHVQTIAALEHVDYNTPGLFSYEQAFGLARRLGLDASQVEQLYRRMVFNLIARNQDDHVKNVAFLMDRTGTWSLAPAYDLTWSYKPGNRWLHAHQMTVDGKRDDFTPDDLARSARVAGLPRGRDRRIARQVADVVSQWATYADRAGVDTSMRDQAGRSHRLALGQPS